MVYLVQPLVQQAVVQQSEKHITKENILADAYAFLMSSYIATTSSPFSKQRQIVPAMSGCC
jgi:hypothetical protein